MQLVITPNPNEHKTKSPKFSELYDSVDSLLKKENLKKFTQKMPLYDMPANRALIEMMACTHSIGILNDEFVGDPLDVEMLKGTNFVYQTELDSNDGLIEALCTPDDEFKKAFGCVNEVKENGGSSPSEENSDSEEDNNDDNYEIGIIRRFEFSSTLQRMSVITRSLTDSRYRVFCKGSPEKIKELSLPHTVPDNFHEILTSYTQNGLRVLGLACKIAEDMSYEKVKSKQREEFEKNLVFCGFLIMENTIKEETYGVIKD